MYNYFYNNLVDFNNGLLQAEDKVLNCKPMHEIPCFPKDIWYEVLKQSKTDLVALACASQSLNQLVVDYAKNNAPADCFGAKEWKSFGADAGVALPVPLKMIQDFDSLKWMLTWIPERINGQELTLSSFDQFVSDFKNGEDAFKSNYKYPLSGYGINDKSVKPFKAHWVMLSKDVLDGTWGETSATQEKLVKDAGFEIPNLIDAVVSVLLHNLKTGDFVYPDGSNGHERVHTRVQGQINRDYRMVVGGFSALGLDLISRCYEFSGGGIGASCSAKSGH